MGETDARNLAPARRFDVEGEADALRGPREGQGTVKEIGREEKRLAFPRFVEKRLRLELRVELGRRVAEFDPAVMRAPAPFRAGAHAGRKRDVTDAAHPAARVDMRMLVSAFRKQRAPEVDLIGLRHETEKR